MDLTLPPLPKYEAAQEQLNNKPGESTDLTISDFEILTPKPTIKLYPLKSINSLSRNSIYDGSIHNILNDIVRQGVTSTSSRKSSIASSVNVQNSSFRRQLGELRSQEALFPTKCSEKTTVSYQTEMKDQVFDIDNYSTHKMSLLVGIPSSSRQPSIVNINISRRNSIVANVSASANISRRSSLTGPSANQSCIASQRRGSLPVPSLMPLNIHFQSQTSEKFVGVDREIILSAYIFTEENKAPLNANEDYYSYIYSSQNIGAGSLNFINRIESSEITTSCATKKIKTIGRFLIGDQVGKGAFGKVKEGVCTETLVRVAVKVISKKRARKVPQGVQNIIREIKLLRKFKHENVIGLIDVYCKVDDNSGSTGVFPWFEAIEDEPITWVYEDGSRKEVKVTIVKFYLIFQYCPWTLQGLLDQSEGKKFTIDRAHYFFVQLMDGLYYLHAKCVIHRDIKPGNMLITQGKLLNISDFGVAEQFDIYSNKKMKTSTFAGTHQFLSPEITTGMEEYDGEKGIFFAN